MIKHREANKKNKRKYTLYRQSEIDTNGTAWGEAKNSDEPDTFSDSQTHNSLHMHIISY